MQPPPAADCMPLYYRPLSLDCDPPSGCHRFWHSSSTDIDLYFRYLSFPLAFLRAIATTLNAYTCLAFLFLFPYCQSQRPSRQTTDAYHNREHSDALKSVSTSHPQGITGTSSAICSASAATILPQIARVTAPYPKTEPPHLLLWTTGPVTAGTTTLHTRARLHFYVAVMKPSDVRESCNAAAWGELRGPILEVQ